MSEFENQNKIDNDASKALSNAANMRSSAVSFLTESADGINKYYEEQHAKLLESEKKSLIQTAETNKETNGLQLSSDDIEVNETVREMLQNNIDNSDGLVEDGSVISLNSKGFNNRRIQTNICNRTDNENSDMSNSKIQTKINKKCEITVNDEDTDISEEFSDDRKSKKKSLLVRLGIVTRYQLKDSRRITLGLKTVNTANRQFNKLYQKGKRLHSQVSEGGNIQTGLKDFGSSAKKVAAKPINAVTKPAERKIKTAAAKGTLKLTKLAVKAVMAVGKLLIKLIGLLIACLPAVAVILVILIVVISVYSIFGTGAKKSEMDMLKEYMITTQQEYDNMTVPYYEKGNIVENSMQGRGHIDWKAPLSILQGLLVTETEMGYGQSEQMLLDSWKEAGLFEKIEDVKYKETIEQDGKQKEITVKKKVITYSGLDDYIKWCEEHWQNEIRQYLAAKKVHIETSFTEDQLEIINSLYNSESFNELLGDVVSENNFGNGSSGNNVIPGGGNGTLRYPTDSKAISAGFPNYSNGSYHGGIDFPVPMNTNVCAAEDGKVIFSGTAPPDNNGGYGNYVVLEHKIDGRTIITLYGHNTTLLVKYGDTVKRGQVIAKSGSTGNSTGPHVHFEVQLDKLWGTRVNPLNYLD